MFTSAHIDHLANRLTHHKAYGKTSSKAKGTFDLSLGKCTSLRRIRIGMCIMNYLYRQELDHVSAWQNEHIWEPSLGVVLKAPPEVLTHVSVHIAFTTYEKRETPQAFFRTLSELNWAFIDRVLDRFPRLVEFDIQFPDGTPWFEDARRIVRDLLSEGARQRVRFSLVRVFM